MYEHNNDIRKSGSCISYLPSRRDNWVSKMSWKVAIATDKQSYEISFSGNNQLRIRILPHNVSPYFCQIKSCWSLFLRILEHFFLNSLNLRKFFILKKIFIAFTTILTLFCFFSFLERFYEHIAHEHIDAVYFFFLFRKTFTSLFLKPLFLFVCAARRRRDIKIPLCLSAPVWKSLSK